MQKIIFITGTDTSVGKTVLSALLISHLRQIGSPALALKPFCSGGRDDAELLHSLQQGDLTLDEINPFHFSEPIAPLVAARNENRQVPFDLALQKVRTAASRFSKIKNQKSEFKNSPLLIEGAGGLLAPLGEPRATSKFKIKDSNFYTAFDLITVLNCSVIVVAPNRLGAINHTLLTVRALRATKIREIKVVLMDCDSPTPTLPTPRTTRSLSRIMHRSSAALLAKEDHASRIACRSNPVILTQLLSPIPLFCIPHIEKNAGKAEQIQLFAKKFKKTLARILACR